MPLWTSITRRARLQIFFGVCVGGYAPLDIYDASRPFNMLMTYQNRQQLLVELFEGLFSERCF